MSPGADLSASALKVYIYLCSLNTGQPVTVGASSIVQATNVSRRSVFSALSALEQEALIQRETSGRREKITYRIILDKDDETSRATKPAALANTRRKKERSEPEAPATPPKSIQLKSNIADLLVNELRAALPRDTVAWVEPSIRRIVAENKNKNSEELAEIVVKEIRKTLPDDTRRLRLDQRFWRAFTSAGATGSPPSSPVRGFQWANGELTLAKIGKLDPSEKLEAVETGGSTWLAARTTQGAPNDLITSLFEGVMRSPTSLIGRPHRHSGAVASHNHALRIIGELRQHSSERPSARSREIDRIATQIPHRARSIPGAC